MQEGDREGAPTPASFGSRDAGYRDHFFFFVKPSEADVLDQRMRTQLHVPTAHYGF